MVKSSSVCEGQLTDNFIKFKFNALNHIDYAAYTIVDISNIYYAAYTQKLLIISQQSPF